MNDKLANLHVKKGCQHADGTVALAYARSRHADPQLGDIARGGQQREVMAAVGHKALSPWTVINPFRYWNLWTSTTDNLTVDKDMGVVAMGRFGWAMTHSDLTCPVPLSNLAVTWDPTRSKQMFPRHRQRQHRGDRQGPLHEVGPAEGLTPSARWSPIRRALPWSAPGRAAAPPRPEP